MTNDGTLGRIRSQLALGANAWLLVHGLAVALIALPALVLGLSFQAAFFDDAFITFRYSYNLARGNGFVYNIGEYYMGTTTPLYALILGLLGIPNPEAIPRISQYLSAFALMFSGIGCYVYGWLHKQPLSGLLAGLFWVVNPILPWTFGGEMILQVALIIWALIAYKQERTILAAALLALAILTRMDSALAPVVVGVHYLAVRRKFPWRELLTMAGILVPWMILCKMIYGSFVPDTLASKLAQRDSGLWLPFATGTLEWLKGATIQGRSPIFSPAFGLDASPSAIRFILFVGLGGLALWRFRGWGLPLAWAALHTLVYSVLNAPFYHWYMVPSLFGLMILAGVGVAGVADLVIGIYRRFGNPRYTRHVTAVLSAACVLVLMPGLVAQTRFSLNFSTQLPKAPERLYTKTGRWFKANTPEHASVGYVEIGFLGYYSERRIIDALGLVNEGGAEHVATKDLSWAYAHYRPDYIIHNPVFFPGFLDPFITAPWFTQEYREINQIAEEGGSTLTIYQRQPSATP